MARMTLEQLRRLREEQKIRLSQRETDGKEVQVIIGMGTCGIAAGAKDVLDAFLEASEARNLRNVIFKQTGCMGLCSVEPIVEVRVPGMPDTIYGNVDAETAREIVKEHIVRGRMVNNHIFDRPAGDIVTGK